MEKIPECELGNTIDKHEGNRKILSKFGYDALKVCRWKSFRWSFDARENALKSKWPKVRPVCSTGFAVKLWITLESPVTNPHWSRALPPSLTGTAVRMVLRWKQVLQHDPRQGQGSLHVRQQRRLFGLVHCLWRLHGFQKIEGCPTICEYHSWLTNV